MVNVPSGLIMPPPPIEKKAPRPPRPSCTMMKPCDAGRPCESVTVPLSRTVRAVTSAKFAVTSVPTATRTRCASATLGVPG